MPTVLTSLWRRLRDGERGSAPVEFVLVSVMLTTLTLAVMQLALAMHVRNTVLDAAGEGARFAALAGNTGDDGVVLTRELIATAVGSSFAQDVTIADTTFLDTSAVAVTVRAPLPVIGLLGFGGTLEVTGHAAREAVD